MVCARGGTPHRPRHTMSIKGPFSQLISQGHGKGRSRPRLLSRHPSEVRACRCWACLRRRDISSSVRQLQMATRDHTGHPLLLQSLCPHSTLADCAQLQPVAPSRSHSPISPHTRFQARPGAVKAQEALPSKTRTQKTDRGRQRRQAPPTCQALPHPGHSGRVTETKGEEVGGEGTCHSLIASAISGI